MGGTISWIERLSDKQCELYKLITNRVAGGVLLAVLIVLVIIWGKAIYKDKADERRVEARKALEEKNLEYRKEADAWKSYWDDKDVVIRKQKEEIAKLEKDNKFLEQILRSVQLKLTVNGKPLGEDTENEADN